jgi:hypothetical protein
MTRLLKLAASYCIRVTKLKRDSNTQGSVRHVGPYSGAGFFEMCLAMCCIVPGSDLSFHVLQYITSLCSNSGHLSSATVEIDTPSSSGLKSFQNVGIHICFT